MIRSVVGSGPHPLPTAPQGNLHCIRFGEVTNLFLLAELKFRPPCRPSVGSIGRPFDRFNYLACRDIRFGSLGDPIDLVQGGHATQNFIKSIAVKCCHTFH